MFPPARWLYIRRTSAPVFILGDELRLPRPVAFVARGLSELTSTASRPRGRCGQDRMVSHLDRYPPQDAALGHVNGAPRRQPRDGQEDKSADDGGRVELADHQTGPLAHQLKRFALGPFELLQPGPVDRDSALVSDYEQQRGVVAAERRGSAQPTESTPNVVGGPSREGWPRIRTRSATAYPGYSRSLFSVDQ